MINTLEKYPLRTDSLSSCKLLFSNPIPNEAEGILLRSRLQAAARRLGFNDIQRQNMVLVAAEMVSNQIKYAGGRGMLQIWQQPGLTLDILALDFGPGIPNLPQAQQDGYSSHKTLGKGLGSIKSLSHESGIYTVPEVSGAGSNTPWHGCVFWSRFSPAHKKSGPDNAGKARDPLAYAKTGLFARALSDDRYNGDRIYVEQVGRNLRCLHMDGLGHGILAQQATDGLAELLFLDKDITQVLRLVDRQLKNSRGAVGMLSDLNLDTMQGQILGVGDMSAYTYIDDQLQTMTFAPGILGKEHKTPGVTLLPLKKPSTLITASDGMRRGWNVNSFPALLHQHPQMIAYVLGNIMGRASDDQSLCVVRIE